MSEVRNAGPLLTPEEGFAAMFEFLTNYWNDFKTANIADVLSDVHPAYGGTSSDPAMWPAWLQAVKKVLGQAT
jgi:hypothetical protein